MAGIPGATRLTHRWRSSSCAASRRCLINEIEAAGVEWFGNERMPSRSSRFTASSTALAWRLRPGDPVPLLVTITGYGGMILNPEYGLTICPGYANYVFGYSHVVISDNSTPRYSLTHRHRSRDVSAMEVRCTPVTS
jgi:hypothetical protein